MHPRFDASSAIVSGLVLALSAGAAGQSDPQMQGEALATDVTDQPQNARDNDVRFQFGGAYTHRFETDLDSGGSMTVDTLSGGLNISTDLNRDVGLTFRINYGVSLYDFDDGGSVAGFGVLDPWDDIHTLAFGAAISADLDDQWSVFGGPVFQFSRETGADWEKSFTGGIVAGATYAVSEDFLIGGGVGIVSQIEDSARFFPIIIVEWVIDENWRISSRGPTGGRSSIEFTGVELVWEASDAWEFALGGGTSFSRFRLDDDAVAPDGVGQDESTPIWLRTSWLPTPDVSIDLVGGIALAGEVTLDDEDGDSIAGTDTDEMTPFIGVFGSIRF